MNSTIRTSEIDHFFPKSEYPALAMCFFNFVSRGKACNGLKLIRVLGVSPYEAGIEDLAFLYPDLPVGINLDTVRPEVCIIDFHSKGGMARNVTTLSLDSRYERHAEEALRLLRKSQSYTRDKIDEIVHMGLGYYDDIIEYLFGPIDPAAKKRELTVFNWSERCIEADLPLCPRQCYSPLPPASFRSLLKRKLLRREPLNGSRMKRPTAGRY